MYAVDRLSAWIESAVTEESIALEQLFCAVLRRFDGTAALTSHDLIEVERRGGTFEVEYMVRDQERLLVRYVEKSDDENGGAAA